MSLLVGAWSLSGARATDLLGRAREAMCAPLPGSARELDRGRLWLRAHIDKLAADGRGAIAFEGVLATERPLERLLADARCRPRWQPEGQFAIARHDGDRLELSRSNSGGERLYYARLGELFLFACSLRPLLAHPELEPRLDPDVARDVLLTGHPIRGDATPVAGVHEVLPGQVLGVDREPKARWFVRHELRSPEGDLDALGRRYREALAAAVERAVGKQRPVAVALSGGIDSSAIAAAAVEVVGADAVHAFTYEFGDPTHPSELSWAQRVVKALGIGRHEVFKIHFSDFIDAIPEHVWRSESAVHWPKAFLLPVARHIASRGYDRYLTGFGIGSHMSYLRELSRVLPWLPAPGRWLRAWKPIRFGQLGWTKHLAKLHPGFEPPHPRLYHLLLEILEARGIIADRRALYPEPMKPLLRSGRREASGRLDELLQQEAFAHLISCIDVTRSEKASREVGACRLAPAHFASCLPYSYFPVSPPPPVWSAERHLRPGKLLLRHAYRGVVPDAVLFRKKSWADAVISPRWRKRGRVFMLRALPEFPGDLDRIGPGVGSAVEWYEPHSIQAGGLAFRLWIELLLDRSPSATPPSWRDLWPHDPDVYRAARELPVRAIAPPPVAPPPGMAERRER